MQERGSLMQSFASLTEAQRENILRACLKIQPDLTIEIGLHI